MSDILSHEEMETLIGNSDMTEFESLKLCFDECAKEALGSLSTVANFSGTEIIKSSIDIVPVDDFKFTNGDFVAQIDFKSGLTGFAYLNLDSNDCKKIAASMSGMDNVDGMDEEIISSAVFETMNQTMGRVCTMLSRSLNDTIDMSPPDAVDLGNTTNTNLFGASFKHVSDLCKISYSIKMGDILMDLIFVLLINSAKSASFKIKTTDSKNLLRKNPELAKTIAEYFTLLGVKYKAIYSMIGIVDNVSVLELNSIHSLQCLDVDVINNYNVINTNRDEGLHNVFIFEKDFVSDVKNSSKLINDEDSTWGVLKELNSHFSYKFLEYCSDNNLSFDNVECNNFLALPDNQYLLVSYCVGKYKFYQLLSFALVEKIKKDISKTDREKIDSNIIENLAMGGNSGITTSDDSSPLVADASPVPAPFSKLPFEVCAELGVKEFTIKDLLHINVGYIIHFDKKVSEDVDVSIGNVKKAEAEVGMLSVYRTNNYAIKIKKILKE